VVRSEACQLLISQNSEPHDQHSYRVLPTSMTFAGWQHSWVLRLQVVQVGTEKHLSKLTANWRRFPVNRSNSKKKVGLCQLWFAWTWETCWEINPRENGPEKIWHCFHCWNIVNNIKFLYHKVHLSRREEANNASHKTQQEMVQIIPQNMGIICAEIGIQHTWCHELVHDKFSSLTTAHQLTNYLKREEHILALQLTIGLPSSV
jgi:hypothetical protein